MFSSVRTYLTLWYTAAMAIILIFLASVTYFVLRQNVRARGDAQAVELADTFLSTVNAEMGESTKPDSLDYGVAAAISDTWSIVWPRSMVLSRCPAENA